jgi:Ca2+-binding EF-hand superfamily protein
MNTLAKLSLASALMLSATFGVAVAQQANDAPPPPGMENNDGDMGHGGKHHGGRGGKHGNRHGGRGMQMIDANNDGIIGEDEAAALADHAFQRMDNDGDGKVTEAEFVAGPHGKRGWFDWNSAETAAVQKVRSDKFATLDVNKDKSLDKVEFFADAKAKLAAADTDKDGKVSPWEFRASR